MSFILLLKLKKQSNWTSSVKECSSLLSKSKDIGFGKCEIDFSSEGFKSMSHIPKTSLLTSTTIMRTMQQVTKTTQAIVAVDQRLDQTEPGRQRMSTTQMIKTPSSKYSICGRLQNTAYCRSIKYYYYKRSRIQRACLRVNPHGLDAALSGDTSEATCRMATNFILIHCRKCLQIIYNAAKCERALPTGMQSTSLKENPSSYTRNPPCLWICKFLVSDRTDWAKSKHEDGALLQWK